MSLIARLLAWCKLNSAAPTLLEGSQYYCLPRADGRPFEHGIQLVNDNATPILFVLEVLQAQAGLSHREASVASALCHQKGGVIVPMISLQHALEAAAKITEHAENDGWPLRCSAVSAQQYPSS